DRGAVRRYPGEGRSSQLGRAGRLRNTGAELGLSLGQEGFMAFVKISVEDGVADIVLDRPKVNALNRALLEELGSAFERVTKDSEIRGALLRSEGRSFSAGLDLKEVAGFERENMEDFLKLFDRGVNPVFSCPKPLAVAVQGHAIAGGLVLALCADFLALGE